MASKTTTKKKVIRKTTSTRRSVSFVDKRAHGLLVGYDFILLVNATSGKSIQLSGTTHQKEQLYQKESIHREALSHVLKKGIFHYEWTQTRAGENFLYQTTCIALQNPKGETQNVLSLSRDVTHTLLRYQSPIDGAYEKIMPRTFTQILLDTREMQKKEISKALHDEIGSNAVVLTALLSLVRASLQTGNEKQALHDLAQLDEQLKRSIDRLKNVIVSLRPLSLENKGGLGGAIRDLLENISAISHIPYSFDYDELPANMSVSEKVKILLYRIVQEALTNIVKHSHAKHMWVYLKKFGSKIRLLICDDGVGFRPTKQRSIEHVGLLAMKDSVKLLGGNIAIKSAPNKGTHIEVICPGFIYGGNNR